jgi:hypothetical protein
MCHYFIDLTLWQQIECSVPLKMRPDYSGWDACAVSCASVNVDGFTSLSPSSAITRSPGLEGFAAVSVELSVHTGQQSPRVSAARVRGVWTHLNIEDP